jgi:YVTN family beta-propeller protein
MATSVLRGDKAVEGTTREIAVEGPYIGPRPFGLGSEYQKRFFGRDYEADEILSLILAHSITLVYAQSGAGKTSIFNAKILPTLQKRGFEILPTARVKIASPTDPYSSGDSDKSYLSNIYISNSLQSMRPEVDSHLIVNQSLRHFLETYFPLKKDEVGRNKPQIVIFDQFEEIFTVQTRDYTNQQKEFFKQIVEALDNNPVLRVVFVIREEYIARLDPFSEILPDRLRYRFRLERLKKNNAIIAVRMPLKELGFYSKDLEDDIKDIVENLEDEGEYIEPIHLQVVCQRWWQQGLATNKKNIGENVFKDNDIADVDTALEEFYDNAVHDAILETKVSEKNIREWCEHKLITPSETRSIVHQSRDSTDGIPNNVIEILDKKYLIRPELRSREVWYELTHDRLIKPIKNSNILWRAKETKRKSRRNRLIIIPSFGVAASVIITLIILFFSQPPHMIDICSKHSIAETGVNPDYVAVNPNTNTVYVTNGRSNTLSVVNCNALPGSADLVVNTVKHVGNSPIGIAVNPTTNMIYVTNSKDNTVSVIDGKTNNILGRVQVGTGPQGIAVNPTTNMIYVTNSKDNTVSVIDGKTNNILGRVQVGTGPQGIAVNPNTNIVYVTNGADDTVSIVEGTKNQVTDVITVGENPRGIAVNPATNTVYVTDTGSRTLSVIDGKTNIVMTVSAGGGPLGAAVDPKTNMVFVVNDYDNDLLIRNSSSIRYASSPIQVGHHPYGIAYNVNDDNLYVANQGDNTTSVIDGKTNKVIANIKGFNSPYAVAVNPNTNRIYVTNNDDNTVSVIDGKTNKVIAIITLGNGDMSPWGVAVNPITNMIYAALSDHDTVSTIDGKTNKVIANITVGKNPQALAVNPTTNMIYVANNYNDTVSVIDGKTNKVITTKDVGGSPDDIVVNARTDMVYVADHDDNVVSVIDGRTNIVTTVRGTGTGPHAVAVNSNKNIIYVGNVDDDTVSYLDGTTNDVIGIPTQVGRYPNGIAYNTINDSVYVVNKNDNNVSVIAGANK